MTREGYLKNKKLIEAWGNGDEIEVYNDRYGEWQLLKEPNWHDDLEYRVKPKPQFEEGDVVEVVGLLDGSYHPEIKNGDKFVVSGVGSHEMFVSLYGLRWEHPKCYLKKIGHV